MPEYGWANLSVKNAVKSRIVEMAGAFRNSPAEFVERCVDAIEDIARQPRGKRTVPLLAKQIAASFEPDEPMVETNSMTGPARATAAGALRRARQKNERRAPKPPAPPRNPATP